VHLIRDAEPLHSQAVQDKEVEGTTEAKGSSRSAGDLMSTRNAKHTITIRARTVLLNSKFNGRSGNSTEAACLQLSHDELKPSQHAYVLLLRNLFEVVRSLTRLAAGTVKNQVQGCFVGRN
jgi:hypothetical protein